MSTEDILQFKHLAKIHQLKIPLVIQHVHVHVYTQYGIHNIHVHTVAEHSSRGQCRGFESHLRQLIFHGKKSCLGCCCLVVYHVYTCTCTCNVYIYNVYTEQDKERQPCKGFPHFSFKAELLFAHTPHTPSLTV